jgi:drug/metabolite transporter (DMT)-like permease
MAFILRIRKQKLFSNFKQGLVLGICLWIIYIPQTIGLTYTSAANSGFITGLFVAFVPILSLLFFKRPATIMQTLSVFVSAIGLWILTGGLKSMNPGDIITLVTAMVVALYILIADRLVKELLDPYILAFQQFFIVALLSLIGSIVLQQRIISPSVTTISTLLYLAIFPTVLAFLIQLVAQKVTTPVKVSLIFAMEPVFGALFAWTIGKEHFFFNQALGGLIIVSAIILSELPIKKLNFKSLGTKN